MTQSSSPPSGAIPKLVAVAWIAATIGACLHASPEISFQPSETVESRGKSFAIYRPITEKRKDDLALLASSDSSRAEAFREEFKNDSGAILSTPRHEQALLALLPGPYSWFSLGIDKRGEHAISALSIATEIATEPVPLGEIGGLLPRVRNLESLYITGYKKAGLSFADLGELIHLRDFSAPMDTSDKDLVGMKNLHSITDLDLSGNTIVNGEFLAALREDSALKRLDLTDSTVKVERLRKLLELKRFEIVSVRESRGEKAVELSVVGLTQAMDQGILRNNENNLLIYDEEIRAPASGNQ